MIQVVVAVLVLLNLATFVAYGVDKWKARHGRWRVKESSLLIMAAVGGSVGAWLGMVVWRHKTLHRRFRWGIPLMFAVQVALVVWLSVGMCS